MAFTKSTFVSCGNAPNHSSFHMAGHAKPDSATRRAVKLKRAFPIRIEHSVYDLSGKGRGAHDGKWIVETPESEPVKLADWAEGHKEQKVTGVIIYDEMPIHDHSTL